METMVTVWYFLRSFDGVELIEGPTPEVMPINHHICTQPWRIKRMAEISFEGQFPGAIIQDIEIGDTAGIDIKISDEKCRFPNVYDICLLCPVNSDCTVGERV